ncbi:MAG: hypothetical protein IKY90_08465 [Oscillospiraceae bacterium]|nr:hypothetical protein [Oscillospiraceae bacterium]
MDNNELKIEFNDEVFRNVYEECLNARMTGWTLNLSAFTDSLLKAIESMADDNLTKNELIELDSERPKELSKEEKIISATKKAHDLSLYHSRKCYIRDKYIYGLHSFSYEEFLYYIFWRTKLRENKIIDTPNSFLAMFLVEIVNFIEYDNYKDCLDKLLFLKHYFSSDGHKLSMINTAIEEFILLYGSANDYSNNCNASKFDYIFEADEIISRTHSDTYNFIFQHTSGSFKQLSFYKKYKNCIGDDFGSFFYNIVDYFNSWGIDILKLWFGQKTLECPIDFSYIKYKFQEKIKEKNIIYRDNIIYSVSRLSQNHISLNAQDEDLKSGQCVFFRGYLMRYPLRLYENIKRKELGLREINAESALDDIAYMSEKSHILTQILSIYLSDDFQKNFVK